MVVTLIGFSSPDQKVDLNNNINVAGPFYASSFEQFSKTCLSNAAVMPQIFASINYIKHVYLTHLSKRESTSSSEKIQWPLDKDNIAAFFDKNRTHSIDKKFLSEEIDKAVNFLKTNNLCSRIYGVTFYEEPRDWIPSEVEFCQFLLDELKNKLQCETIKYCIYHPTHILSWGIEKYTRRVNCVKGYDMILQGMYYEYNTGVDRSSLVENLKFFKKFQETSDKKQFSPVLLLGGTVVEAAKENVLKMLVHDMLACRLFDYNTVFVWSLFKRRNLTQEQHSAMYSGFIESCKFVNSLVISGGTRLRDCTVVSLERRDKTLKAELVCHGEKFSISLSSRDFNLQTKKETNWCWMLYSVVFVLFLTVGMYLFMKKKTKRRAK